MKKLITIHYCRTSGRLSDGGTLGRTVTRSADEKEHLIPSPRPPPRPSPYRLTPGGCIYASLNRPPSLASPRADASAPARDLAAVGPRVLSSDIDRDPGRHTAAMNRDAFLRWKEPPSLASTPSRCICARASAGRRAPDHRRGAAAGARGAAAAAGIGSTRHHAMRHGGADVHAPLADRDARTYDSNES